MQRWFVICWALLALVGADKCPDGGRCKDGQTCCYDPANGYECCPFAQAECCGDHMHCCPAGSVCDTATSSCLTSTGSIPWVERVSADQPRPSKSFRMIMAYKGEEGGNICPDQSQCPPEFSCLKTLTRFGCCPVAQGVPCSDGKHCCPESHQCSANSRSCIKKELVSNVICGDGVTECPSGNTCCKSASGIWGCCPVPQAVCCTDGIHCCPSNYKCEGTTCTRGDVTIPAYTKLPATTSIKTDPSLLVKELVTNVICGDGVSECPSGNTCCKSASGIWGCCPVPQAVCCTDGIHCCPSNYKCEGTTCTRGDVTIPAYTKLPATTSIKADPSLLVKELVTSVICGDGVTECPSGNTCCKSASGIWGCCPVPQAVCCTDGIHCCPSNYKCEGTTCTRGDVAIPAYTKLPATTSIKTDPSLLLKELVTSVICGDGVTECPSGNTCCKSASGIWGCCPVPQAVCCTDGIHCCPSNYKCEGTTCTRGDVTIPAYTKLPATTSIKADPSLLVKELVTSVICGDGVTECPSGNTCCETASGIWGCCPVPQAVCCTDGIHCCPSNYKCEGTTCTRGDVTIPAYTKLPATTSIKADPSLLVKELVTNVICGDGVSECPSGNTCCKSASGIWGCCPVPQAVCCTDGIHCCPSNYKCEGTTCTRGDVTIPAYTKLPATTSIKADPSLLVKELVTSVICGDGVTECPSGNTCCETASGPWGCCPVPQAVCCTDGIHCCPFNYKCEGITCTRGDVTIPAYTKLPATTSIKTDPSLLVKELVTSVICGDGVTECPSGNTCCETASGIWGCCPVPQAVCCTDGIHCCPSNYKCEGITCTRGDVAIPAYTKLPATTSIKADPSLLVKELVTNVICGDGVSECPSGNTCCETASGIWGCCPVPQAVCCSNMLHCCPYGYTCTDTGHCIRANRLHWQNWQLTHANNKRAPLL